MVILSGAHTLGRSHYDSFIIKNRERLASDTISPTYQSLLEALCPTNTIQVTNVTTMIDLSTPTVLDNNYCKLLQLNLGLHFSDDQLVYNAMPKASVDAFAADETLWKEKFIAAMIKMGKIEPKTGTQGEIRLNCSVVNTPGLFVARVIKMLHPGSNNNSPDG
uniref:Plant heme peroxidase family profile domain-containing protein n=1 Tax=Triticum urartu TaxID=4572 RepID=A0A8R7PZ67_TRIUA